MSGSNFHFCGIEVTACLSGALILPAFRTLVVSDLHLEKASRWARRGRPLPPYDSRATLAGLTAAVECHAPRQVICLGDSFDDADGGSRLSLEDAAQLQALMKGRTWIWIAGNHDPLPPGLGGDFLRRFTIGALEFRHAPAAGPVAGEVSGHYHPKAAVAVAGRRFSTRCFAGNNQRLILPAFGALAGGLDVFAQPLPALLGGDFAVRLLGRARVHLFPASRLIGWAAPTAVRNAALPVRS